jgi:hypothetical protein
MEFSYRITQAEYVRASRFGPARSFASKFFRVIMGFILFWVFVLVGLMLLWVVVERSSPPHPAQHQPAQKLAPPGAVFRAIVVTFGPFILIGGAGVFLPFGLEPMLRRREYRNDARMQGMFNANLAPGSISILDSAGVPLLAGGDAYEWWREAKGLVVLRCRSGRHSIVSLAELPEARRVELRGILVFTIPKR